MIGAKSYNHTGEKNLYVQSKRMSQTIGFSACIIKAGSGPETMEGQPQRVQVQGQEQQMKMHQEPHPQPQLQPQLQSQLQSRPQPMVQSCPPDVKRLRPPVACTECHGAKVKCDKVFPCVRCQRMGRECIPHESNQGRGAKRRGIRTRRAGTGEGAGGETGATTTTKEGGPTSAAAAPPTRNGRPPSPLADDGGDVFSGCRPDEDIARCAGASSLRSDHYGLVWLVRSWLSFALRRRSMALLSRASALASRAGIPMDAILCGEIGWGEMRGRGGGGGEGGVGVGGADGAPRPVAAPSQGGLESQAAAEGGGSMTFLHQVLLVPSRYQTRVEHRLLWSELPRSLLEATNNGSAVPMRTSPILSSSGAVGGGGGQYDEDLSSLGDRLIFVREFDRGHSRYLVSPAFERCVAPWDQLQRTWNENIREVMSIFRPKGEDAAHVRKLCCQLSIHPFPGRPPRFDIPTMTAIRLVDGSEMKVNSRSCLEIVTLDLAYSYVEYFPLDGRVKAIGITQPSSSLLPHAVSSAADHPFDINHEVKPFDSSNPPWFNWNDLQDSEELNELLSLFS